MGSSLYIQSDSVVANRSIPAGFSWSDGKEIAATLGDEDLIACLERYFGLDLSALTRIRYEETDLEFWLEEGYSEAEAAEMMLRVQARNEAAWQEPDQLAEAVWGLLMALKQATPEGDDLLLREGTEKYVIDGVLIPDLTDLLNWTLRLKENGASKVLLSIY